MANEKGSIAAGLTGPKIAARVVLAGLLAAVVAIAAMATPDSSGFQPLAAQTDQQPSPTGTPTGTKIEFVNPDTSSSLEASNKNDGTNQTYHLVAAVKSVPATPTVQFRVFNPSDQQIGEFNATRIGSTDTWEHHWDLANIPTDDETYEVRAILLSNGTEVPNSQDSEDIVVNKADDVPPVGQDATAAETVEITYPANGGQLGVYRPAGGTSNFIMEGTTSSGTRFVRGFYSVEPAGTEPAFKTCAEAFIQVTPPGPFKYHCDLADADAAKTVTAVAMVPNDTPQPVSIMGGAFNDSGDGHRVFSYSQQTGEVRLVPSRTNQAPTTDCVDFTATVLDQVGRPISGHNLDTHAVGPTDTLRYKTNGGGTNEARVAPDQGHSGPEAGTDCSANGTGPNQGNHASATVDEKHVETPADGGTNDDGVAIFGLLSNTFGTTQVVAWADSNDNDSYDSASEECGIASIGWGQPNQAPTPSYPGFTGCSTAPSPTPSGSVSGSPTTSPSASTSPSGSPTTSPSGSPTTSPSTSPTTSPTQPEKERHDREVTVSFDHGSLIVSGRMSVDDGENKCRRNVPVKIQRRITKGARKGKYKTLKTTLTNRQGRYSASVKDKPGVYRVKAPKTKKGRFNEDICKPTKKLKRHRH